MLGAARALQILGSPRDEIEGVALSTLNPETKLPLKVRDYLQLKLAHQLNAFAHRQR